MKRFKYLTLAALVAFAACDETEEPTVAPPVTGAISGVVTIEGVGASGVTVTLSSGATATTDGSGAYTFSDVSAGAYTVTISGFASDATFTSTSKAATISTSGQVVTVNFDGSYIRTSAIIGSVAAGGMGLSGVTVSIGSSSTTTDSNGQYAFSGLRAGSYTVSISGWDSSQYTFSSTSTSVTLGVGESKVASFSGSVLTTAKIMGRMFLDENDKDDAFTAGLEDNLSVANVTITIEGGAVNNTWTVETDADGMYEVTDLAAGTYRVTIDDTDTDLPGNVAFGLTSNSQLVTVTTGATGTVNWPFDISQQTVKVYGFLGTDADVSTTPGPGITPIKSWTINLYDTQANASAGGATGRLGSVATDSNGEAIFRFARSLDVSPNSSETDQIVFAQVAGAPTATHALSGENIIEIKYNAKDSMAMAPDTFDALYNQLVVKAHAEESDADTLANWNFVLRQDKDSTFATTVTDATDANGDSYWTLAPGAAFPDTIWVRLSTTQAGAGGHGFTQAPTADEGMAAGRYLMYIWDGTTAAGDTVELGTAVVTYTDVDLIVNGHHERDDSTDTPTYTAGDDLTSIIATEVQLYNSAGTSVAGPIAGAATGLYDDGSTVTTVAGIATGTYTLRARSNDVNVVVLNDTIYTVDLDGSDQTVTFEPLKGGAGSSAFAIKTDNNTISGSVLADDGAATTAVKDVIVTLSPTSDNIQGTSTMVDTTDAAGAYSFTGVREGPYTVTVADIAGEWEFFDTLTTTSAPTTSGSSNNTDAHTAARELQGYGVTLTANFRPRDMNTTIQGAILNDRDNDGNTIDAGEALIGATIELYEDTDGDGVLDTGEPLVASTTTGDEGEYEFTGLKQGDYIVQAPTNANADITRGMSAAGVHTRTAAVTTSPTPAAAAPADGANNTDRVGTKDPAANNVMPSWDYTTDGTPNNISTTHFTFLNKGIGIVEGTVLEAGSGKAGVDVILTRCYNQGAAPSPPAAGACTTKVTGSEVKVQTDSNGDYTFTGVDEGVYMVETVPASVGLTAASNTYLVTIQQSASATDTETVPDITIS